MSKLKFLEESRVVIAIPLAGPMIYWRTVAAILEMEKPSESDLSVFQGALVDRARNHLIEQMLAHPMNATHIFFLDADIIPAPDTLTHLLDAKKPIVSGLYRRRLPPHEPLAYREGSQGKLIPVSPKSKSLTRTDVVGGGCLLIERRVFEKIKSPWFTSEWTPKGHLSEDFSFCKKAKKADFEIFVDPSVCPLHIEPMGIGTDAKGTPRIIPLD